MLNQVQHDDQPYAGVILTKVRIHEHGACRMGMATFMDAGPTSALRRY